MSLDEECILRIFSERWDGATGKGAARNGENWDKYKIKRIKSGWFIKHIVSMVNVINQVNPFYIKI